MAAGIVDQFELVEVYVTKRIDRLVFCLCGDDIFQSTLELVTVDEAGQGIVCCLEGELSV